MEREGQRRLRERTDIQAAVLGGRVGRPDSCCGAVSVCSTDGGASVAMGDTGGGGCGYF